MPSVRSAEIHSNLSFQEPVHRVVEFMHIDFAQVQFLGKRVLRGIPVHACGTTEFRPWRNNPISDHGHHEAALNGHRAAIADERLFRGQPIFDDGQQIVRQVGDIGHGLMLDLAVLRRYVETWTLPLCVFLISATCAGRLSGLLMTDL